MHLSSPWSPLSPAVPKLDTQTLSHFPAGFPPSPLLVLHVLSASQPASPSAIPSKWPSMFLRPLPAVAVENFLVGHKGARNDLTGGGYPLLPAIGHGWSSHMGIHRAIHRSLHGQLRHPASSTCQPLWGCAPRPTLCPGSCTQLATQLAWLLRWLPSTSCPPAHWTSGWSGIFCFSCTRHVLWLIGGFLYPFWGLLPKLLCPLHHVVTRHRLCLRCSTWHRSFTWPLSITFTWWFRSITLLTASFSFNTLVHLCLPMSSGGHTITFATITTITGESQRPSQQCPPWIQSWKAAGFTKRFTTPSCKEPFKKTSHLTTATGKKGGVKSNQVSPPQTNHTPHDDPYHACFHNKRWIIRWCNPCLGD